MRYLNLIWRYKWATIEVLVASGITFALGALYGPVAVILGMLIFVSGFAFPVLVANQAIKEEEEAEDAEERPLEDVILELREAGLVQIHPGIETEVEKKTE